jgi:hypothetical protein
VPDYTSEMFVFRSVQGDSPSKGVVSRGEDEVLNTVPVIS